MATPLRWWAAGWKPTLRFRDLPEVERDLDDHGFEVVDVRDAPDRPGLEHVILARAAQRHLAG